MPCGTGFLAAQQAFQLWRLHRQKKRPAAEGGEVVYYSHLTRNSPNGQVNPSTSFLLNDLADIFSGISGAASIIL
jgi:hypothetical protein